MHRCCSTLKACREGEYFLDILPAAVNEKKANNLNSDEPKVFLVKFGTSKDCMILLL